MNYNNPLISIIVPVYNVEKQLSRCLDSILQQTYTHFELLLVNDGSKDASGEICNVYAQNDSRIRVFHKENGGTSSARNVGIEQSNGEYICFIDSDDCVDKAYLSAFFVDSLKEDKYTFVIQSYINERDGLIIKQLTFQEGLCTIKDFSKIFYSSNISYAPFCKLYNAEIIKINNIRFNPKIHYAEDLLFLTYYLLYIKNVYFSIQSHYHYINRTGSLSTKLNSYESEILTFSLLNHTFKNLIKDFHLDSNAIDYFNRNTLGYLLFRAIIAIYRSMNKKPKKKRIEILKELHTKDNAEFLEKYTQNISIKHRIGYLLFKKRLFILFDLYYSVLYSFYKLFFYCLTKNKRNMQ